MLALDVYSLDAQIWVRSEVRCLFLFGCSLLFGLFFSFQAVLFFSGCTLHFGLYSSFWTLLFISGFTLLSSSSLLFALSSSCEQCKSQGVGLGVGKIKYGTQHGLGV
jgi:hypothetical protein